MIKAIIFDCFGVLATEKWLTFKDEHFAHDPVLFEQATNLMKQANADKLSYGEFITRVAQLANVSPAEFQQSLESNVPNQPLFDYISNSLHGNYKLGILSNTSANRLQELFIPQQLRLFDALGLSYEMRLAKPNEQAYHRVADMLEAEPEDCVFVDDQQRYVTAGQNAGMQAIWYQNFTQFQSELDKLLQNS